MKEWGGKREREVGRGGKGREMDAEFEGRKGGREGRASEVERVKERH